MISIIIALMSLCVLGSESNIKAVDKLCNKINEIPIKADGKQVQISLIITNGALNKETQIEAKGLADDNTPQKKEQIIEKKSTKSLGKLLLTPLNTDKPSDTIEIHENQEKLISDLKDISNDLKNKLDLVIETLDSQKKTHDEADIVNYHVIEITENKSNPIKNQINN